MTLLFEADDLCVSYRVHGRPIRAVTDVGLQIEAGTTVGLVGESGSGKSTIAKAIMGLQDVESGALRLDGTDVTSVAARQSRAFRRSVQMVFQDPFTSLDPRMRVRDLLAEGLRLRDDVSRSARPALIRDLLASVELAADAADRYPFQFSGGQRQRIAIARALAVSPRLLVADEVTSALDVSVQASVINLLRSLQRETGVAMLFISHNLGVVRYVSDSIVVMTGGRVVESGPTDAIFAAPQHEYTRTLIGAIPRIPAG